VINPRNDAALLELGVWSAGQRFRLGRVGSGRVGSRVKSDTVAVFAVLPQF